MKHLFFLSQEDGPKKMLLRLQMVLSRFNTSSSVIFIRSLKGFPRSLSCSRVQPWLNFQPKHIFPLPPPLSLPLSLQTTTKNPHFVNTRHLNATCSLPSCPPAVYLQLLCYSAGSSTAVSDSVCKSIKDRNLMNMNNKNYLKWTTNLTWREQICGMRGAVSNIWKTSCLSIFQSFIVFISLPVSWQMCYWCILLTVKLQRTGS